MLSRGLLTSRSPQALGQASVPHSDFFSHLAPGPPQNFNQAFCPDDSQLPSSTPPLSLRVFFFFWPLQNVSPIVLTPRPPEESLPLSSVSFWGGHKTPSCPSSPHSPSHLVPSTRSALPQILTWLLPSFRAQPKCHLLREASPASLPHSHVTQVYYLQEHLSIYFAYCLFLPL